MKKTLIAAAVAAFLLAGCEREENVVVPETSTPAVTPAAPMSGSTGGSSSIDSSSGAGASSSSPAGAGTDSGSPAGTVQQP